MRKDLIEKSDEDKLSEAEMLRKKMMAAFAPNSKEVEHEGDYPNYLCLLLDRSGSMNMRDGDSGFKFTRIDEVRKIAKDKDFKGLRKFQYNQDIQELKEGEDVQMACGDNNEPRAFSSLKLKGINHVIMVTDGGADNPRLALQAAKGLKIDIFYIGPEPIPQFLIDLAKQTGGTFEPKVTLLKELAKGIKKVLLLDAPKTPEKKKGAICL